MIGRKFADQAVQTDMKTWPFEVINDGGKPKLQVEYKGEKKMFFPEEVSSMILVKMKETAEAYLGKVFYLQQFFAGQSTVYVLIMMQGDFH